MPGNIRRADHFVNFMKSMVIILVKSSLETDLESIILIEKYLFNDIYIFRLFSSKIF